MVNYHILVVLLGALPILFSGCKKIPKYYDLVPSEFPQGEEPENISSLMHKNLRSVKIYNQFTTEAIFDVLYFSDAVQAKYVDSFASRRGKSEKQRQDLVKGRRDASKNTLTYYMLADIRDTGNQTMFSKDSAWTVYLVNALGQKVEPTEIKEVELESEIRQFFMHRYSRYKIAYLVTFPCADELGNSYFKPDEKPSMVVSSITQERTLRWDDTQKESIKTRKGKPAKPEVEIKDEDFYWG